ncbi:DUF6273 domain-containing protein [Schwartzia succinivorans]|jgi:hypothetical protein|uniref:DUF6273 domain-containing protein n=1 Tax=Schwartzia succinivorans DSM 10502 TaxID=1123243 RepID=A0A1M4YF55_9FIRM|nr:DUF6273 domain-containing protein [Schwartzia succinivorans]SHF04096.1 hypothetical protein SAMN02745190_01724 [Schwartzia succinivorans DSM 10502]
MFLTGRRKCLIFLLLLALCCTAVFLSGFGKGEKPYGKIKKGDVIAFGVYEQDGNTANGPEPVEWLVIDRIGDEALLMSACCIDARPYNDTLFAPVTWETSALRRWLNGDFLKGAFSEEERSLIRLTRNQTEPQAVVGTSGGRETEDYVFIPDAGDMSIYVCDAEGRQYIGKARASEQAVLHGAKTDRLGLAEWWLRSPGVYEFTAQFVNFSGEAHVSGANADMVYAVRPALWLDISNH